MNSLLINEYDGQQISFTDEGWFNATQAAAKFGKRPNDWLNLASTKEYISALRTQLRISEKSSLIKIKQGGVTRKTGNGQQGTWLHPKLAVAFSRWLDVNFGIWCDLQIDKLLRGKLDQKKLRHEAAAGSKLMSNVLQLTRAEGGKPTECYNYANEHKLVNWALSGKFARIDRDSLYVHELNLLAKLQEKNTVLICRGVSYPERKKMLKQYKDDLMVEQQVKLAA